MHENRYELSEKHRSTVIYLNNQISGKRSQWGGSCHLAKVVKEWTVFYLTKLNNKKIIINKPVVGKRDILVSVLISSF